MDILVQTYIKIKINVFFCWKRPQKKTYKFKFLVIKEFSFVEKSQIR